MSRLIRAFFGKDEQETRIREKNTITKLHPKTMAKAPLSLSHRLFPLPSPPHWFQRVLSRTLGKFCARKALESAEIRSESKKVSHSCCGG
jgi:hypothetical protein